ncbi:unnamed protein product [Clonostachys rosea f. rosea IK726]|uniref:Actin-related protein RO7 n=2 Tax=Bionectria ochroleuca TaxID=29856 RepID=A0A0B7JUC5_BIOOC|nr:unnamed protein product [Clonostachys rosea f. rosea IK726]
MASGAGPTTLPHRSVTNIRSGPSQGPPGPSSPHTPPRNIASVYGSPSTVRADDEIIVVEIGSRFIRAGFAGDSLPKATVQCGPEQQRRAGDFRAWQTLARKPGQAWAAEHEIWRYDLREVDIGLVRDKLDRLLRDAFTKHLLLDSRPRRTALVLDSDLPLPLVSAVLDTVFDRFQTPMVSLLSSATMSTVAAGTRSALIINMGWSETVITSVYEYREVKTTRTVRGGRHLLDELYNKLLLPLITDEPQQDNADRVISFEEAEDIMCRLMWCRPSASRLSQRDSAQLETVEEQDESDVETPTNATPSTGTTQVPFNSTVPPRTVDVAFESLGNVCDDAFLDPSAPVASFDDHEFPVHLLVYQHLLQLPIDVRAICMSRIIFTGGCSTILGLKERIVDEVSSMIDRRGWEPVSGKGAEKHNQKLQGRGAKDPSPGETSPPDLASRVEFILNPANAEPEYDSVEAKIERYRYHSRPVQGKLRALHSLGPWAGASLMCQLKISAMATIDRELWQQQGSLGASKPNEVDFKAQQRQSMGAGGLIRGSGGHHMNWTLGAWGAV